MGAIGNMKHGRLLLLFAVLFGIIALSATLFTVAGTPQHEVYLAPQNGATAPNDSATVELWINATNFQGGQISLQYDTNCVNVTNWERNTTNFPMGGWDTSIDGREWVTLLSYSSMAGEYHAGTFTVLCSCKDACMTTLNFTSPSALFDPNGDEIEVNWLNGSFTCSSSGIFDTGPGTYPSISGIHNGTIKPSQTITVSSLYTYALPGTGGHTESVRLWNATAEINATWTGYGGDWHNITFTEPFVLYKNETYNYTLRTGSYPRIHHNTTLVVPYGEITCTGFTDANGEIHYDWIPAIRLA